MNPRYQCKKVLPYLFITRKRVMKYLPPIEFIIIETMPHDN